MENGRFLFRHYEFVITSSIIAIMALLIFMMNLGKAYQVGFLIAAAFLLGWGLHSRPGDKRPPDAVIKDE